MGERWRQGAPVGQTQARSSGGWITDPYKESNERRQNEDQNLQRETLAVTRNNADRAAANEAERLRLARDQENRDRNKVGRDVDDNRFDRGTKLANAFQGLPSVKTYTNALPVYSGGLKSAANGSGDLQLINAFAKVVDPNSVVRETEAEGVAKSDAWINSTVARLKNELSASGGLFSVKKRQELREEMATRMSQLNESFISDRVDYKHRADRAGVNPLDVVGPHPGARFQKVEAEILGRSVPQLDYDGNPVAATVQGGGIAGGDMKRVDRPELEKLADGLIRGGLPYEQVNAVLRQNGAGSDIDRKRFDMMRDAIAKGYRGKTADASYEAPTTALNRLAASPTGTALYAGADAALGGTTDEIASALGGYDLADLDARKQALFAQNPKAAMTGQIAGSIGSMVGLGKLTKLPALAVDLGFGAFSGAGQDNDNRLGGAAAGVAGSLAGNVAGALIAKPIGALARTETGIKSLNVARSLIGRLPGVDARLPITGAAAPSVAEQTLVGAAERAGVPDIVSSLTDAQVNNLPFTLADTSPSMGELTGAAVRRSPVARDFAENVLGQRSRAQIERLGASVEQNLGPIGNTQEISRNLANTARTNAAPLYDASYAVPGRTSPELESLLETPFGREGLNKARTIAANERRDPNAMGFDLNDQGETILTSVPSMQTIDYAKRGMDDVLEQHRNPITNRLELSDAGRAQNLVKNQFLTEADRLVPEYRDARRAYQGPMESIDALHRGQDFHGSSVNANQIASIVPDLSPEHLAQTQLGYRDALMDRANAVRYSSNPWLTLDAPGAQAKLTAMYPDGPGANNLLGQIDAEKLMASTQNRVIGGSQTAPRQIADEQFLPSAGTSAAVDAVTAASGGVPVASVARALMTSKAADALRLGMGRKAEAKAAELIPMMLNTNPVENLAVVRALLDQQAAYRTFKEATTPTRSLSRLGAASGSTAAAGYVR